MNEHTHMVKLFTDSPWVKAVKNENNNTYFVEEGEGLYSLMSESVFAHVEKSIFYNHCKFETLIQQAVKEAQNAMVRFPQPNYVLLKVAEEAGEVVKEGVHCSEGRGDYNNLQSEVKQTVAMLYRLCVEGDETIKLKPVLE